MRNAEVGEKTAEKYAGFYILLSKANLPIEEKGPGKEKVISKKIRMVSRGGRKGAYKTINQAYFSNRLGERNIGNINAFPSIHLDIQIHISSDAKPEQIDQIFLSMSKYLYGGVLYSEQTDER
jgi:hypothetical protein